MIKRFSAVLVVTLSFASCVFASTLYSATGVNLTGPACTSISDTGEAVSINSCEIQAGAIFSGSAAANYSALHASSSLSLTDANLTAPLFTSGYARLTDRLEGIDALDPNDTISFGIAMDGSWSNSGLSLAKPVLTFGFDYGQPNTPFWQFIGNSNGGTLNTLVVTPGYSVAMFQQNDYFISLSAQEQAKASADATGSAYVDFSNTVAIDELFVRDANGNLIGDLHITSDGMNGQEFAVATPEPSSLLLLGSGVLAAIGQLRSKR
jgi:hypothetical protein